MIARIPVRVAIAALVGYKRFLSPLLPRSCRYTPTCSEYSRLAFEKYGFLGGCARTVGRLMRCQPFGATGVDLP